MFKQTEICVSFLPYVRVTPRGLALLSGEVRYGKLFQPHFFSQWKKEGQIELYASSLTKFWVMTNTIFSRVWTDSFSLVFLLQGIVKRDEIVFRAARRRGIPILMVTSGGYQKKTARIIADSILNLHQQGLIGAEVLEGEGSSSLVTNMMCSSGSVGSKFTAVWDTFILTGVSQTAVTLKGAQVTLYYVAAVRYCYCCQKENAFNENLWRLCNAYLHIYDNKRNLVTCLPFVC